MSTCPECGEEIDHLTYEEEVIERGTITIKDDRLHFEEDETEDPITFVARCPKCEAELFYGNDDCEAFLKEGSVSTGPQPACVLRPP
jgi:hypothetical protein